MKKALSFAVALGLVAGAASVASAAELTMTGDARMRGIYRQNTDFTDHVDAALVANQKQDTEQFMDQRVRLNLDVKVNDDVTVNTRLVYGDDKFGMDKANKLGADRYNMVIKTLGGTWTLGRQAASWANAALPYLAKDVTVDRIKGIYKAGDLTFGGYLQKNVEGNGTYANGDGDSDTWGALVIGKAGDTTWGVLANYNTYDGNDASTTVIKKEKGASGYMIDPYFVTKVGPATLLGELKYTGGDLGERYDKAMYGGYMAAVVGLDPVTLTGLLAYSKNNCAASDKFAPSLLIGKTNATAMIDFGDRTPFGVDSLADPADRSYLVGGVASFKASDKLTLGALVAYLGATKHGFGGEKGSLIEADLTAEFALAQNAKYKFGIGYGDPSKLSEKDDAVFVVGNSVEVAW